MSTDKTSLSEAGQALARMVTLPEEELRKLGILLALPDDKRELCYECARMLTPKAEGGAAL